MQALKRKYDREREKNESYEELLRLLQVLSEPEAQNLLRQIRQGASIATAVASHTKPADILRQLALTPESRMRYEFPYRTEMPTGLLSNNPYLGSLIYEAESLYPGTLQGGSVWSTDPKLLPEMFRAPEFQSLYLKPIHAAEVVEPLLSAVKPSLWTTVCTDDALMTDILRVFFRCEYGFQCPFPKTYFLEDMAAMRQGFCSPLLVNAVLAYACVRRPTPEPDGLSNAGFSAATPSSRTALNTGVRRVSHFGSRPRHSGSGCWSRAKSLVLRPYTLPSRCIWSTASAGWTRSDESTASWPWILLTSCDYSMAVLSQRTGGHETAGHSPHGCFTTSRRKCVSW